MTITVIAKITAKEGKLDEVIAGLKKIVPKVLESEPGCLEYIPHTVKGRKNKNIIVFYEKYKDQEAFNVHNGNLAKNMAEIMPLLEPGLDVMQCSSVIEN